MRFLSSGNAWWRLGKTTSRSFLSRIALLGQDHDGSRFDSVFRADYRDFIPGLKDIFRRLETRVHYAMPRFLQAIEDRKGEWLGIHVDHDIQIVILL